MIDIENNNENHTRQTPPAFEKLNHFIQLYTFA